MAARILAKVEELVRNGSSDSIAMLGGAEGTTVAGALS
jgi:hypothetical protein